MHPSALKSKGRAFALPFLIAGLWLAGCDNNSNTKIKLIESDYLLESLDSLTIQALRKRNYESQIKVEAFTTNNCMGDAKLLSLPEATGTYKSFMASFESDGLRQYARITLPDGRPPTDGFPYVLFLHGYVGQEKAPTYSIGCNPDNPYYSELTDAFARAGFAVLAPGYRGHATVEGIPAEGIQYLESFDQGAGLSTQFYAIDALNFAAGVGDIDGAKFPDHGFEFDPNRFYLTGHSQGGDAGLTYLAAVGEGQNEHLKPIHSALWSGTFLPRLTALERMMPVGLTAEAFLSGDGSWTGTAVGKDGVENPNFIFGYPPDWIEDPNPDNWTWQKNSWTEPNVTSAINKVTGKMYTDLSENVEGFESLRFKILDQPELPLSVQHDPRITEGFSKIGGYNYEEFLQEPITLHVPERDHYSQVSWNENLCKRITNMGGSCEVIIYPDNNHSMRASSHSWFSPEGTADGYPTMMQNFVKEFSENQPPNEGVTP